MYKQLRQPNLSVKGISGLCLNYARRVFNIGAKYPTAWTAWLSSIQHRDRKLPNNSVPIWFSYYRAGVNVGHVAVYVPGKGVYSSPIGGRRTFTSLADIEKSVSNIKYVGWSEDINKVRIIIATKPVPKPSVKQYYTVQKGDTVDKISRKYKLDVRNRYEAFRKLNPSIKDINKINVGQKVRIK